MWNIVYRANRMVQNTTFMIEILAKLPVFKQHVTPEDIVTYLLYYRAHAFHYATLSPVLAF